MDEVDVDEVISNFERNLGKYGRDEINEALGIFKGKVQERDAFEIIQEMRE